MIFSLQAEIQWACLSLLVENDLKLRNMNFGTKIRLLKTKGPITFK